MHESIVFELRYENFTLLAAKRFDLDLGYFGPKPGAF